MEGKLSGVQKDYPLELKKVEGISYTHITVNNQDELLRLVIDEQRKPYNKKKKLYEICDECGIQDTVMLYDERTMQLFELWSNYRFAPHLIDSMVFFDANVIFNMILGQRMI